MKIIESKIAELLNSDALPDSKQFLNLTNEESWEKEDESDNTFPIFHDTIPENKSEVTPESLVEKLLKKRMGLM